MIANGLKRDAERVKSSLKIVGQSLVATQPTVIHIPARYLDKDLAEISDSFRSLGVFAIEVDGHYCVCNTCANVYMTPSSVRTTMVDGSQYYLLEFDKGDVIVPNINLVKIDTLAYYVFDEFIFKGNIPWFLHYEDIAKLFFPETIRKYCGVNLGTSNVVLEMVAATMARDNNDKRRYYRQTSLEKEPFFVGLKSSVYGATNVTARLLGSYFDDNLLSATVNPTEKSENVEALLR